MFGFETRNRYEVVSEGGAPVAYAAEQAMMAVADTIMVLAICQRLGRFATLATISLTTNFLRAAVRQDVVAVARVKKLGRTTAFGEVDFFVDGSYKRTVGSGVASVPCTYMKCAKSTLFSAIS